MRVLLLVLVAAVAVPVSAAAATAQAPMTIQLISVATSDRVNDVPPRGPSRGDTSNQTSRLLNAVPQFGKPRNSVVGRDRATITLTGPSSGRIDGVTTLPGGTLVVRGAMRLQPGGGIVFPVVRGTGRYAGARGTVTILGSSDPLRAVNVYRLVFPPKA
jgi:hypothetical protein